MDPPGYVYIMANKRNGTIYLGVANGLRGTAQGARYFDELVEEMDALLQDAVRLQMIADRPVGTFLSGGLDSSIISALMRRQTQGDPLHPAQLFLQQETTGQHTEERHQKVSQTGFDNVAGVDAPDIHQPVGRQQQRRQYQPSSTPDRGQRRHRRTPPLSPDHHQQG